MPHSVEGSVFVDYALMRPEADSPPFYRRLEIPLSLSVELGLVAEGLVLKSLSSHSSFPSTSSDFPARVSSPCDTRKQCLLVLCLSNMLQSRFDVTVKQTRQDTMQQASTEMEADSTKKYGLILSGWCYTDLNR
jgi:hypothetical protein